MNESWHTLEHAKPPGPGWITFPSVAAKETAIFCPFTAASQCIDQADLMSDLAGEIQC